MAKPITLAGHKLRQAKKKQQKEALRKKAANLVTAYLQQYQPIDSTDITEHYHAIDAQLSNTFTTFNNYRVARQGFLDAVRAYNKANHFALDEPVVPIVSERDKLTISYDWFVEGSKVSETWQVIVVA